MSSSFNAIRLPLPEVFLLYGQAKSFFNHQERLFQWAFGTQQRIQCVEDIPTTQAILLSLKNKPFMPVIIFDEGEAECIKDIIDSELPIFSIIDAEDEPNIAEYALCNPEVMVESVFYSLLDGEHIIEPDAIWYDNDFLSAYSEAFVQWLHKSERYSLEPLITLSLDFFKILLPQHKRVFNLAHCGFPLAWLSIEYIQDGWRVSPCGVLANIIADELYVLYENEEIALTEVPAKLWDNLEPGKVLDFPVQQRQLAFSDFIPAVLAAADGKDNDVPQSYSREFKVDYQGKEKIGDYSIMREDFSAESNHQVLVFKCSLSILETLQGKTVEVVVGDTIVELGKVDRRGLARSPIPRSLDLSSGYIVNFYMAD